MMYGERNDRTLRSALLLGTAAFVAGGTAAPAMAQDDQGAVETVVVTGSRIPQQGLYSSSPVTAVGQQEMKLEGTTGVENLLNNLPGVFADMGSTASNGASGTANVNLRGLGSQRTLVLIDGKRLMPSDAASPVADLNTIPAAMVDHVEVLTGGASAVYGSDAEAGVVNFILRKNFEGVELDGQYSFDQADNGSKYFEGLQNAGAFPTAPHNWIGGQTADVTLLLGSNTADGKGNVTAYLSYRNVQPVLESKRDFSACSLSTDFAGGLVCAGSSNYNFWRSWDARNAGNPNTFYETGTGAPGSGAFVPFTGTPDQKFNYGPLNYLQRPDTRYTAGFDGHYQISKEADIYANFMFMDDETRAQIAPSAAFIASGPAFYPGTISPGYVQVNCSNPLMTAQENFLLCGQNNGGSGSSFVVDPLHPNGGYWGGQSNLQAGAATLWLGRRNIEGGNRIDDRRHTSYRMVVGMKGDLGDGWSYDVYGQYGVTLLSETFLNELSKSRVENALNVVIDPDPASATYGRAVCTAALQGFDPGCVPLDFFNGFGAISPAAADYISGQGFQRGLSQEQVVSGSITGDLGRWGVQSPWAQSPVAVAFGAEYRSETLELQTSREFEIDDLYGQGGATLSVPRSSFNVVEGFGEIQVPLVQNKEFFEDLSLNAGFRYSSYSTAGAVTSYKYGLEWQPVEDFRLRGSYQRAVRAPNVLESFAPFNVALFGGNDPCATSTAGQCATVPNAGGGTLNCPASQCNQGTGGNINLKPETSDTKSFGIVLTPTFLDGFTLTVDYFDIKVSDYISPINPNTVLSGCYGSSATAASIAYYCPLVHRAATGAIFGAGYVDTVNRNLPYLSTKGIDFEANYTTDLEQWGLGPNGAIAVNFVGTWLDTLITKPSNAPLAGVSPTYNCAGLYGVICGTPSPEWRHKMRVTWSAPWDFDVSVSWRHLSGVHLDENTSNGNLNGLITSFCAAYGICSDPTDDHVPAVDYFDISGTWTVREGLQLRAGVNNVFDKTPPVMDSNSLGVSQPPFGNGNTYPQVYDALGRTFFIGGTVKY